MVIYHYNNTSILKSLIYKDVLQQNYETFLISVYIPKADVVFMLDPSYTIGRGNLIQIIVSISNTIDSLQVGTDAIRIGVVVIGTKHRIIMHLNSYKTKDILLKAVDKISIKNSRTDMEGNVI